MRWNGQRVRTLTFPAGGGLFLEALPAHHYLGKNLPPSVVGTRAGAVAATNGQFVIPHTTTPKTPTFINGIQVATGNGHGFVLSISQDGTRAITTRPTLRIPPWAYQVFGGTPLIVSDGVNLGKKHPYDGSPCPPFKNGCHDAAFTNYNPRTAVGITQGCTDKDTTTDCTYMLVVVDGRQPPHTKGLRFPALGALMQYLGAYDAINLDGGGSTVMWTRVRNQDCVRREKPGCLVNRVSGAPSTATGERPVLDAIGVMPVATPSPTASPSP
jgi:hypothetical protein